MTKPERKLMFDSDKYFDLMSAWSDAENGGIKEYDALESFIQSEIFRNVKEFADRVRPLVTEGPYPKDEWVNTAFIHQKLDAALKEFGIEP